MRGSSPHTRGARLSGAAVVAGGGIIPAYAGSTTSPPHTAEPDSDHPRIRGEHGPRRAARTRRAGSSPHTRGAPPGHRRAPGPVRIIPAYAGSTSPSRPSKGPTRDHPRIRGEHGRRPPPYAPPPGSSPHTRGARRGPGFLIERRGIIPAYAGSTTALLARAISSTDHPRIRGEHALAVLILSSVIGSSPHTRGAHHRQGTGHPHPVDHPRIRGEHALSFDLGHAHAGSSPHTRGAPWPLSSRRV